MSPETCLTTFKLLSFLGAALAFVSTIGVWHYSGKLDKVKDAKIDELVDGKDTLLAKIEVYQRDLDKKSVRIQELEVAAAPRTLSAAQKARLCEHLASVEAGFPLVPTSRLMDVESANYAAQLADAFREAGWQVSAPNPTFLGNTSSDVTLAVTEDSHRPVAGQVAAILNAVGVVCRVELKGRGQLGVPTHGLYLIVGAKAKAAP